MDPQRRLLDPQRTRHLHLAGRTLRHHLHRPPDVTGLRRGLPAPALDQHPRTLPGPRTRTDRQRLLDRQRPLGPYAVLYTVFHANAERWLGTLRWLTVVIAAHVLATLVSEGVLAWAIRHGYVPESAANTLDIGVSYALAGVVAVLTYRVPQPWRYVYLFAVVVFYGVPLITGRTFTDLGHFASVLIGLACYPLARSRSRQQTNTPPAQ